MKRARSTVLPSAFLSLWIATAGCDTSSVQPLSARDNVPGIQPLGHRGAVDSIDILLAIDNSRSMADKQQILAEAVPDLVEGLVNPRCVDSDNQPSNVQPASPSDPCPEGTERAFPPVFDIHIGLTTSSLGGHGADACPVIFGKPETSTNNDRGHLIARTDAAGATEVPTYQDKKFLAWDPEQTLDPPGQSDKDALLTDLRDIVVGAGQIGCGYESQLESVYRFLVDPAPYETISLDAAQRIVTDGVDAVLLEQRKGFLRPDSLLTIIMLTDENDCSIRETGQFYLAAQISDPAGGGTYHLPKARAICQTDPLSACCRSCGQPAGVDDNGDACPEDPTCGMHDEASDTAGLRCFDQKRRFGIDFLYDVDRYVEAFTQDTVVDRNGQLVPNPIFSDLDPTDDLTNVRGASLVFLSGIVGVPWQDIANDPNDLTKGFKTAEQLALPDANGLTTWDVILGDPASFIPPSDPHMVESVTPRSGTNPITGTPIAPPGAPAGSNEINGHERITWDDLQYACIFDLPIARDCSAGATSCDCFDPNNDDPLCEDNPNDIGPDGTPNRTLQVRAKAYPGLRELAVLKGLGSQGVVGSICPAQMKDPGALDYGYRQAMGTILDRLVPHVSENICFPRKLAPIQEGDQKGQVPCFVLEARSTPACSCDHPARQPLSEAHEVVLPALQYEPSAADADWNCYCEVTQLAGEGLNACQQDPSEPLTLDDGTTVDGWCYIDAEAMPALGNPSLVEPCNQGEKRALRFVGRGKQTDADASRFLICSGE